jgi:hypothetical protein
MADRPTQCEEHEVTPEMIEAVADELHGEAGETKNEWALRVIHALLAVRKPAPASRSFRASISRGKEQAQ